MQGIGTRYLKVVEIVDASDNIYKLKIHNREIRV